MLLMLIEMLTEAKFEIVGCNTDAVEALVPKDRLEEYKLICEQWEVLTKMKLDHEYFSEIFRLSCNHYIAIKADKDGLPLMENEQYKVKEKGWFEAESDLLKGYEMPIVKIAVVKDLLYNIPVEDTIRNHTDILDFCISQKMGKSKQTGRRYQAFLGKTKLQDTNRFYAADKRYHSNYILKYDGHSYEHLLAESRVNVVNNHTVKHSIDHYYVNYGFYIKKAKEIIVKIFPDRVQFKQLSLF